MHLCTDLLIYDTHRVHIEETEDKRPMGHVAHLRKQLKSVNTYDFIITLIKKGKKNIIYFLRIEQNFI